MGRDHYLIATLVCLFHLLTAQDSYAADSRYYRKLDDAQRVIVFVHGVLGDGTSTWTAKNNAYWPALIADDEYFGKYSIYTYEYPSSLLSAPFSIDEIAENMRLF